MARSYFNRLVRGGESTPLSPPRPVSQLWKTAQIDAAAAPPPMPSMSASRRSTAQPSPAAAAPSARPAERESRPARLLKPDQPLPRPSRARASQTAISETSPPTPAAARLTRRETAQHDATNWIAPPDPVARTAEAAVPAGKLEQPGFTSDLTETVHQRFSSPPVSSPYEPSVLPTSKLPLPVAANRIAAEQPAADPIEPIPPVKRQAAAAEQPMPFFESVPRDDAADATRADLQPSGPALPSRLRDPSPPSRQGSIAEEPRRREDTVQIGKIEVQILPPPASSHRSPPPAPAKGRLARGYALWPGW